MSRYELFAVCVGVAVALVVAVVVELVEDHRGKRGDYWQSSELMWAEIDLLEAREPGNDAPKHPGEAPK